MKQTILRLKTTTGIGVLVAIIATTGSVAKAQSSGKIEYDIEIKGLTEALDKGAAMLFDSKMTVAYADSNLRQDYKMGEQSVKTTVLNKSMNQAIFYEDGLNGKIAIVGSNDEISTMAKVDTSVQVTLLPDTKVILGFTCKKATFKFSSGELAEYWYTNELPLTFPKSSFFHPKLPGIPLEFSTSANGYFMRFKCTNYSDTIDNPKVYFSPTVSKDFTVIDYKSYMLYLEMEKQEQSKQKEPIKK